MLPKNIDRRCFLRITGATVTATLIAGCTDEEGASEESDDQAEPADDEADENDGETEAELVDNEEEPDYDDFMDDVPNYEGTYDFRDQDEVEVTVGAGDQGLQFEPAAIMVDSGTTVVWTWTGEGGSHNVVHEGGEFESELVDEAGHTFEHVFEEENVYRYICTPHEANGKKGAVAVEDQ
jgi:halocyanin-like protein